MAWRLVFDSAPVPADAGAQFIEALVDWGRTRGGLISVECGSLHGDWGAECLDAPHRRLEFVVDVSGGEDLLARMRKSTRYEVRRAAREGVTVEPARNAADVEAFVALHAGTLEDLSVRKNLWRARVPRATMAAAVAGLIAANAADVVIARKDGAPIGACMFGHAGRTAYYLLNGSSPAGRRYAATHLMIATVLEDFRRRNCDVVNLGGVPPEAAAGSHPDHGLFNFKRGFGGEVVTRTGGVLTLRPQRARAIVLARRALKGARSG